MRSPSETALDGEQYRGAHVWAQGAPQRIGRLVLRSPCHDAVEMDACPGVAIPGPNEITSTSGSTGCQRPRSHCFARTEARRHLAEVGDQVLVGS